LSAQRFPSVHLTIKDGLPSNAVYCVLKDSRGIIWIGTDAGLVKYDGFQLKTFTKKNGLAGNFIRDIKEDKFGNLWIACYGDGLTKFDGKKYKNFSTKNGLVHQEIRRLYFDKKQQLWIGTERGVSVLSGNKFYNYNTQKFDRYDRFQVMQFWEENNQLYFLSRTHGYYKSQLSSGKLQCESLGKLYSQIFFFKVGKNNYFSNHNGLSVDTTTSHFPIDSVNAIPFNPNIIWDVAPTKKGVLMAANCVYCSSGGLLLLKNGKIEDVSLDYGIDSKQLWSFYKDKQKSKIWITTLDDGLHIIDDSPEFYKTKTSDIIDYWEDDNVQITMSTKGLSIHLTNGSNFEIPQKEFYLQTAKKQVIFIRENPNQKDVLKKLGQQPVNQQSFLFKKVQVFDGKIYVSSNAGFFEISMKGEILNVINIETDHFIVTNNYVLYYCPNGNLTRLSKTNDNNWLIEHTQPNSSDEPKATIKIVKLKDSHLFASSLYGVFSLKNEQVTARKVKLPSVEDEKIKDICSDGKNRFYIVNSGNELLGFTWSKGKARLTERINNNRIHGETILNIAQDGEHLFVLTNRGLNVFFLHENRVAFRDKEQGLFFNNVSYFNVHQGKLVIVTNFGTYYWDIASLINTNQAKDTVFLSCKKAAKGGRIPAFKFSSSQQSIVIPLNRICLYHGQKIVFNYTLNGKDWTRLNGSVLSLNQLESGNYTIKIRQKDLYTGKTIEYSLATISKAKPFWNQLWFIVLAMLTFVGFVLFISTWRTRTIQKRERQKSELLKRISDTKLEALQSQMNPHFIFNSLTAIHSFIIKSDVDNALTYMDKFSKLTRQTLEFSSMMHISLLEELEYLSHFIALENMRFGNNVETHFELGELDSRKIKIPPLMIQPLVENAFEHGFTDRNKKYQLYLNFTEVDNLLCVTISDNGEGFSYTAPKPASKAMNIIRERLNLIDSQLLEKFSFTRENNLTVVRFYLPLVIQ
jgi:ligand-binding sensor domain-containing protein